MTAPTPVSDDDPLEAHVRALIDAAPPPTQRQRDQLAVLLRPGRDRARRRTTGAA